MDKAIVFEPFQFIGFHICTSLLEKGYELTGIHLEIDEGNPFWEAKCMEVGRNANFEEAQLTDADASKESMKSGEIVFLSIYDLFMSGKENLLQVKTIAESVLQIINNNKRLVVMLPFQVLAKTSAHQEGVTTIRDFLKVLEETNAVSQFFYLPSIYGPWQPSSFLFQSIILKEANEKDLLIKAREWKSDILYINDVMESLMQKVETGEQGSFLFQNEIPDQWEKGAELLKIKPERFLEAEAGNLVLEENLIKVVSVNSKTPINEGIQKQKDHTERYIIGRRPM